MSTITLSDLGISQEEITQRVVETISDQLLHKDDVYTSEIEEGVRNIVAAKIDAAVEDLGNRLIGPMVGEIITGFSVRQTNSYGEDKAPPLTFTEYLLKQADAYFGEQVDSYGRNYEECRRHGHSWNGTKGTRATYLIHEHLDSAITTLMGQILKSANEHLVGGIEETVKAKLGEIAASLKVTVKR
jgi:hypothetical protein